ncbi:hypothetical protein DsansV1_C13g0124201 [Dioscorea sansibarensis]
MKSTFTRVDYHEFSEDILLGATLRPGNAPPAKSSMETLPGSSRKMMAGKVGGNVVPSRSGLVIGMVIKKIPGVPGMDFSLTCRMKMLGFIAIEAECQKQIGAPFKNLNVHQKLMQRRLVGLQNLAGNITGGNARLIKVLLSFQEAIKDYSTPPEKALI